MNFKDFMGSPAYILNTIGIPLPLCGIGMTRKLIFFATSNPLIRALTRPPT